MLTPVSAAESPAASQSFNPAVPMKREWRTAFQAPRRLIATAEGGRLACARVELAPRLCDRAWIDSFPDGSVGAAYRAFLDRTGPAGAAGPSSAPARP